MNSLDPWRVMLSSPPGEMMVVPAPYYGHPFYGLDEESDLFTSRGIGRAFVGAEAPIPASDRSKLTAALAPVLAPAKSGFTARVELDQRQHLHAAICVDGKCYKTSIDLAPAIAAVMEKFARYHADLHATAPGAQPPLVSGEVVIGAIERAVNAAGDELVGALLDQHVGVACSGFLDDIGNALKGAGVSIYRGVTETVQKLKGPITIAATGAATAFGGPAAGAAASQLVGPIIDSAANLGKDTPAKAAAEQQAKTDPLAAAALATAKDAVAHTIAAFHVTETAKQAAAGQPAAQQQIAQVTRDAEKGDPVAHAVAPLVAHGFSTAIAARQTGSPESYRQAASHAVTRAQQRYQQQSGGKSALALGYTRSGKHQKVYLFHTPQEAQSWYGSLPPAQYNYVALFETRNLGTPLAENFGSAPAISGAW